MLTLSIWTSQANWTNIICKDEGFRKFNHCKVKYWNPIMLAIFRMDMNFFRISDLDMSMITFKVLVVLEIT